MIEFAKNLLAGMTCNCCSWALKGTEGTEVFMCTFNENDGNFNITDHLRQVYNTCHHWEKK